MGVQVPFDYAAWQARFPEFSGVTPPLANDYFAEATMYLDNSGAGPIQDPAQQSMLLNLLTAHIAEIYRLTMGPDGNAHAVSQLVGRINSATQGTVSVQSEYDQPQGYAQYFSQTKYGAAFWAATAAYRTAAYLPGPQRCYGPLYGGRPWFWAV